jgi:hypothetical protein
VEISGPRLRSLLRRAEKIAKSGKYAAAATIYRQLTEEAPETAIGWLGLAAVTADTAEKEQALAHVLRLEPDNAHAHYLQAEMRGEMQPEEGQQFPVVPAAPSIVKKKTTALQEMAKEDEEDERPQAKEDEAADPSAKSSGEQQDKAEEEAETAASLSPPAAAEKKPETKTAVSAPEEAGWPEGQGSDSDGSDSDGSDSDGSDSDEAEEETTFFDEVVETTEALPAELAELFEENNGGLPLESEAGPDMVCYRHRKRETSLRCYSCERYICSQCAIKTPVGYRCPVCVREAENVFFNATPLDYIIAPIISLPLSLLAGFLVLSMGSGLLMLLIIFFLAGIVGGFIGQAAKWAVGRRRGRYLAHIVAACVAMGVLIPGLSLVVAVLFGNAPFFALLGPGLYLFIAVSAAFYRMK